MFQNLKKKNNNILLQQVLLPIVSSISVIGTDQENLALLRTERAVPRFVWLLSGNHPGLLSAAALTMANLTADVDALELLETIDAARLLWSLLKHPSPVVQAGAASAIAAFSERSKVSFVNFSNQVFVLQSYFYCP